MADRRLQVFHTVAKQLSFTKAAELLFMTQPAVTFQVKQLEEHFNTRLFERSHGKISLTPAGELALDFAERILNLTGEMEARISELTGQVSGPLMIGASTTIAEYMLPRLLGEFKQRHPDIQARLTVANSETIENKVADHTLDIGLIESPSHHPNLVTEICCEDELVLICAPFSDLANIASASPQQIVAHPYISRESGSGTRECIDEFLRMNSVNLDEVNVVMELGSREAIKGAVAAGLGVAVVSCTTVIKEVKLGELIAIPLDPPLRRQLSLVYPQEKFRSKLLQSFLDFLEKSPLIREYAVPRKLQ
ncbi:MAG: LysR family transcriptional regulator [Pseudomonadota bacterium]|nr:LysR family transcriptional regulator [Pseudomonadota bacterium]MDP1903915.1 LysR family transcriptional regulator [Pseudomonadota bacterium]MDP2351154.1 LysR family transcriptional regulator [Pseudomonadota bacterium]